MRIVFPTILELLCYSAATLAETGIANVVAIHQYLAARLIDRFLHMHISRLGDALVTLAMVIGAYVKDSMVFAVVPTDVFGFGLDEREETVVFLA